MVRVQQPSKHETTAVCSVGGIADVDQSSSRGDVARADVEFDVERSLTATTPPTALPDSEAAALPAVVENPRGLPSRAQNRRESLTEEAFLDDGNHALIVSATNLGDATAVLPVVSTLVFGFAVAELLAQDQSMHGSVQITLSMAAALSLFTTTCA